MLHNQSILGFSLLVLSCTSPTLGDVGFSSSSSLDPLSPPSSPTLAQTSGHALKDINPPQVHPTSDSSTATGLATMIMSSMPSPSPAPLGFNPAITPTPVAAAAATEASSTSARPSFNGSPHRSSKHHAKIAAHFSSVHQLQAHTVTHTTPSSTHTLQTPESTAAALVQAVHPSESTSSFASSASSSSASPAASSNLGISSTTPASSDGLSVSTSISATGSSATLAISSHVFSASSLSTTDSRVFPTAHNFDDPNPDVHSDASEASQRARKSALLAALLILATLGALGGGILCFRCGVFPCRHSKRRRRGPTSAERTVEEGLRGLAKLPSSTLSEKPGSLVPGEPPVANNSVVVPVLPRNMHAHTLSCSTCPPDSLNGVRGGVSGTGMGSTADIHEYGAHEDGAFEDVTHILSSDVFSSDKHIASEESSTSTDLRSPRDSGTSRATRASLASGSDALRLSTATTESVATSTNTRASRASEGAVSLTAESYTTCESRYSTPSIDRDAHDGPPSPIAEESEEEYYSPVSPQSSASTASGGSVSVLLMTPEQNDYAGLADAALHGPNTKVASGSGAGLRLSLDCDRARAVSPADSDMDIDYDDSDWDVAQTYGAPPAIPLPPAPISATTKVGSTQNGIGRGMKPVKGRPQTGVGLVGKGRSGAVALGGRKVVFMHG